MRPRYFSRDNTLLSCTRALAGVRIIENIFGMLFVFLIVILISDLTMIPAYLGAKKLWGMFAASGAIRPMSGTADGMFLMLLVTLCCILFTLFYCGAVENRPARTLGLFANGLAKHYLAGAFFGFAAFAGAVGMAWAAGGLRYAGVSKDIPWGMLGLLLLGWMIQGLSEEIAFRGWLLTSLGNSHAPVTSVLLSTLVFAALHLGNDGISVLAFINLTLFGIFAALYFLRTRNLWGCAAFHTVWNAVQGNFFGIKVSGIDAGVTVLQFDSAAGKDFLNGGTFGMEGGLCVTAVLVIGLLLVWFLPEKQERPAEV